MGIKGKDDSNFFPMLFGGVSFIGVMLYNVARNKPPLTGIYKHAAFAVGGYLLGQEFEKFQFRRQKQRLLVIQDYIDRHPDNFMEPERKKFKDIFLPWAPTR